MHGIWGHRSDAVLPAAAVAHRVWSADDALSGTFARVGSIALNAVLAAETRLGDRLAVFGQGVIGLLATRLGTLGGADVVAVDMLPRRLETARTMGAVETVAADAEGGAGAVVREWSGGGVDAAIELSGSDRALHEAVRSVVVDGTVVASGFYQGGAANLRLGEEFHHNRVRIVASPDLRYPGRPRTPLGPAAARPHVHGAGPARAGGRRLARHRRRRRRRRGRRLRAAGPRRPGHPPGGAPVLGGPGTVTELSLDTGPRFPADRTGVAILGCGTIAQSAHLPAYEQHGVGVTGVWSRSASTTAGVRERFPFVGRVYASAEELLADPEVRYVDLATGPEGRLEWIEAAVDAGKHVLAQKPLTLSTDDLKRLPDVLAKAEAAGVRVAVNHNGRWAPPWRATTLLLRQGAIGEVVGVTHLHDKPLPPLTGTPFDDVPHMLLTDYLLHWVDITRTWLGDVETVRAVRLPHPRAAGRRPQPLVGHALDDRGHRRHRHAPDRRQRGLLRTRRPLLGARHDRHPERQRAPRLRPARARRRRAAHARVAVAARGSSTASRPRWAS